MNENLEVINHKFLVPGHMHVECNASHALVEKKKHFNWNFNHPYDWAQLIRQTDKKKPFVVQETGKDNFFDFALLLKGDLKLRKLDIDGNPFERREVKWLHYRKYQPGFLFLKQP